MSKFDELKCGFFEELPLMIGVFPFGIAFGILGTETGLSSLQTMLLSSIIFAGASQIVLVQLLSSSTPFSIILTTVGFINVRHVLYGISLSEYLIKLPLRWRLLLAYLITDESFAISYKRFSQRKQNRYMHFHLLGSGLTLWFFWQISTFLGIFVGHFIPESLNLEFAIPLSFIAIVATSIGKFSEFMVVILSAILTIILKDLPWNLWLVFSSLLAISIGVLISRFEKK